VQALVAPGAPAAGWPSPYTLEEQGRLLGGRMAVEAVCALLPRVLDHPPGDMAYLFASSDDLAQRALRAHVRVRHGRSQLRCAPRPPDPKMPSSRSTACRFSC